VIIKEKEERSVAVSRDAYSIATQVQELHIPYGTQNP